MTQLVLSRSEVRCWAVEHDSNPQCSVNPVLPGSLSKIQAEFSSCKLSLMCQGTRQAGHGEPISGTYKLIVPSHS